MTELEQRQAVVSEARTWLKTPYHHQSIIKGIGVDCVMLLIGVFKNAGVISKDIEVPEYSTQWHLHRNEEKYLENIIKWAKPTDDPKPGDIALFKFGRCVSHAGILIENDQIIHSYNGVGVTIDDLDSGKLRDRLQGFYSVWSNNV